MPAFVRRHLTALTALLLFAVTATLYSTVLDHLLIYMEQHRLFRFTMRYVTTEIHQAGWAKVAGDFVAQFFYYPWLGAIVLGLLFALLFAMGADGLRRLAGRANILTIAGGLIAPAILLAQAGSIETRIEPLMTALLWGAIFWVVCLAASFFIRRKPAPELSGKGAVAAVVAAVAITGGAAAWNLTKSYDPLERTVVMIEEEYRQGLDDAVISRANRYLAEGGRVHVVPFFRNMSLLRQGRLAEHAFDYPPLFGLKALYVPWDGNVLKREYGYHLYELIGHVNEAQRLQSEAMTNYGETGRNIIDLTAYNIINGRDRVARRGIRHLRQSLFYGADADRLEAALGSGKVEGRKDFFNSLPDSVNRFSQEHLLQQIGYMNIVRPGDPMTQELFLVGSLLAGDIDNFCYGLEKFGMFDPATMPRIYREALAMAQAHDRDGWLAERGFKVDPAEQERYMRFYNAAAAGNKIALRSSFADSYWYYFNYINPDRPNKQ